MSKSRSGAPRRVAVGLLAGALSVVGIALAPTAGAVDDTTSDRYAGVNRYSTAAAVAGQPDFAGATTAILATGENFPDALAASGLAGANEPAPIILSQTNEYSSEAQDALAALGSLDDVIIVGGVAAISQAVEDAVVADGYAVTRVAGIDRYETASAIAEEIGGATTGSVDDLKTALIATGTGFADALAGGPLAAFNNMPILLVQTNEIPATTEAALESLGIEQVAILGGTAAVSNDVQTALEGIVGNPAVRIAGENRFGTAAAAGEFGVTELGFAPEEVFVANGLNFPDALSCGPLGGIRSAPILLLASVPEETRAFLDLHSDTIRRVTACGGTAAVSEEDLAAVETAAEETDNDAATGGDTQTSSLAGPELQSATIAGFDLEDLAITYTFEFDEELDEDIVNPEAFKLYNTDTRDPALGDVFNDGDEMEIDGETAIVVFNLADYGVANATLAAAEENAVEDEDGNGNPAQSVATNGLVNGSGTGVTGAEVTDAEDGEVEFEFGSPQVAPGSSIYELVTRDGESILGSALDVLQTSAPAEVHTSPQEDEPSTTVVVIFECNGDDLPAQYDGLADDAEDDPCEGAADGDPADLSALNLRRANVISGSTGRIQTADLSGGGATNGPDLSSVTFPDADDDLEDDQVLFTFDENIDSLVEPVAASDFKLAYSHCLPGLTLDVNSLIAAGNATTRADSDFDAQDGEGFDDAVDLVISGCLVGGTSAELAPSDDFGSRSVLVTFDTETLDNDFLNAAQVAGGAVSESGDDNISNNNDEIELGSSQPASLWDDGEVSGPQLIGATVEVDTTFGGDFDAWVLTLEFDKDLDEDSLAGAVSFFYEDADQVESDDIDLVDCEIDDDTMVICEIDDEDSGFADATVVQIDYDTVDSADTYTLSDAEGDISFPNPEASIEVEVPPAPESD